MEKRTDNRAALLASALMAFGLAGVPAVVADARVAAADALQVAATGTIGKPAVPTRAPGHQTAMARAMHRSLQANRPPRPPRRSTGSHKQNRRRALAGGRK